MIEFKEKGFKVPSPSNTRPASGIIRFLDMYGAPLKSQEHLRIRHFSCLVFFIVGPLDGNDYI